MNIVRFNAKHPIFPVEDLIASGSPVGSGPMQPGDKVEVRIEGIGGLKNPVIRI